MDASFWEYDWTSVEVLHAAAVRSPKAGTVRTAWGTTEFCQLGVKFFGATHIRYGDETVLFDTGMVLYLPRETAPDVPYNKRVIRQGDGICAFCRADHPLPPRLRLWHFEDDRAKNAFSALNRAANGPDSEEFAVLSAFYGLLAVLHGQEHVCKTGRAGQRARAVREFLDRQAQAAFLDLDRLAREQGVSPETLRAEFRAQFGVTPFAYWCDQKQNQACGLLHRTDLSIAEVARRVGFDDQNYFSRFFRKHMGMSPTEYRRRYRGQLD